MARNAVLRMWFFKIFEIQATKLRNSSGISLLRIKRMLKLHCRIPLPTGQKASGPDGYAEKAYLPGPDDAGRQSA